MNWAALVLAGSRGEEDPVAAAAGTSHKAIVPVHGRPMIARVVEALRAVPRIERVAVAIERPDLLETLPDLRPLLDDGYVTLLPTERSPSLSALGGFDALGAGENGPVVMTTADNCLLTPEMLEHFLAALPEHADAAAALARAEVIRAAYPEALRTYLPFSDGGRSGCNLFAFRTPAARAAITFWRRIERDRKRPFAMMRQLGFPILVRYATRRLTLAQALSALERRTGARIGTVDMPFAESAIDVDKPEDLALAERILAAREGT